ncbi:uncharacterized protein BT62DRAFT_1001286 [Guyanagaster necrorhizus]|uniref:Uncharacterized protein n=1 Tax=Guyanagaster necrorhizus TaxID=856835 RepID=A0A9P7W0Q4_9AGAR|nr:uncharacterized protein BT62DRAFT_1001286 [Guyanagaster necrorhizus MCA 3950]KAG7450467.1 hypothetical protein BT62DRAFT_1001286 [Guyanagaster necrorhizus MCA 3950]
MPFSEAHPDSHYHYDASGIYASSSDSDGPRTPSYPSPEAYSYSPVQFYPLTEGSAPLWPTHTCAPDVTLPADVPLHAPVPLPPSSSLFYPETPAGSYPIQEAPFRPGSSYPLLGNYSSHSLLFPVSHTDKFPQRSHPELVPLQPSVPLETPPLEPFVNFCNSNPSHRALLTFPTPSELLKDQPSESFAHDFGPDKADTARKARRRAMARSIGFPPTDLDSISSHEKKRHYLECLERYVIYLHEQLNLTGAQPVPLERVSNYRGLSSRSIRTLLVHMENTTRKLNLQCVTEEHRFLSLRDVLIKQEATVAALKQCQPHPSPTELEATE